MSRVAPGDLETLRAFVNTYDPDTGVDLLGRPEGLRAWLVEHSLLSGDESVDSDPHLRARRLREALKRLAVANHDAVPDPVAAREADGIAAGCRLVVRLGEDGTASLGAVRGGVEGALAHLVAIFYTATIDGTWQRFKVCGNDTCQWAFYDGSKNRSGRFCGTACGNAVSARAYRRRKAAERAAAD
jgi:predicted RNA-binding Zn ribbon-like protein